jgi:hypothetical protein
MTSSVRISLLNLPAAMAYRSRSFGNEWAEATFDQTQSPGQGEPNRSKAKEVRHEKVSGRTGFPSLESGRRHRIADNFRQQQRNIESGSEFVYR